MCTCVYMHAYVYVCICMHVCIYINLLVYCRNMQENICFCVCTFNFLHQLIQDIITVVHRNPEIFISTQTATETVTVEHSSGIRFVSFQNFPNDPANICLFKFNNRNTRRKCEISSKLATSRRHSDLLLLTLSKFHTFFQCFFY